MRVLIIGATGMAGHMIYYYLSSLNKYQIDTICYRNKLNDASVILDVYDTEKLVESLREINPDIVINCIGVLVTASRENPEAAVYLNAYFPHLLSKLTAANNPSARLIHVSSDCVFSGHRGMYRDTDEKDALDVYGMTKNLGEVINDRDLTIRTALIGPVIKPRGEGIFHLAFTSRKTGEVNGWEKTIYGGLTTLELAKVIDACIEHNITGLYQSSNGKRISKYELLRFIIEKFNLKVILHKVDGLNLDRSILPSKVEGFSYSVPDYFDMTEELYQFMYRYQEMYSQYFR